MKYSSNWKRATLGELSVNVAYGYTQSASKEKIGPKFLRITDIQDDFINWDTVPYCEIDARDGLKYKLEVGDIVIARTGNSTGATAVIKDDIEAVFASYLIRYKLNSSITDYRFIDFVLRSSKWAGFVKSIKGGSAQDGANAKVFAEFEIDLPPLGEQVAISDILSSFDRKIELLQNQNITLENIAKEIYKHWFDDFEFPNEHGKPYKSSGGRMIDGEMGKIPEGWKAGKVEDIINLYDSKRIPLSSREREKRKGEYPYYGATSIMDYVDDYIFDGIYLLLAEDGSVVNELGYPVLQYVWGKMWVNNHAHVLQGKNGFSTEAIYLLFKKMKVSSIITGAVQLKINQGNLRNVKIILPSIKCLDAFDKIIQPIFIKIRTNSNQIQTLSRLRDTLLPKLISGQIRVKT